MSRARDLSRLSNPSALSVSSSNNRVGINSTIPGSTLDVAGIVSATSFYGDASNLSNLSPDKISEGNTEAEVVDSGDGYFKVSIDGTESLRINSASLLEATGAADVRFTLGSSGTAGTNDSVHIRADSADLKFMSANTGNTIFESNGTETLRITSGGLVDVSGGIQVTENVTPTAGSGVEIFKPSSTAGQVSAFDRDGAAWMDLILKGNKHQFYANSTHIATVSSVGLGVGTTTITAGRIIHAHTPDTGSAYFQSTNSTTGEASGNGALFGMSAGNCYAPWNYYNGPIIFATNSAEKCRILADGTFSTGTLASTPGTIAAGSIVCTNTNAGIFSNNGGDAKIGSSDNQALYLTVNGAGKVKIDTDGRLLIGPGADATPKCGYAGIDVPNYDYSIVMGGSDGDGNRANAANKDGRLCGSHYTNAEEPIGIIRCTSGASDNDIYMGGGSSLINAATLLSFYTAADTTTTTGTERLRIDRNGNFIFKNGALIENGFYNNSTALTGDYDFDLGTYGNVHYSSPYVAGAFTYNLRINASTSLNSVMDTGDTISVTLMTESNNTSYYMTAFKIDSVTQTVKWSGGSAPSAATGSGLDVYSFTVMKMGSNSYKCFGTLTNHA